MKRTPMPPRLPDLPSVGPITRTFVTAITVLLQ
jgi:hypothetical protein